MQQLERWHSTLWKGCGQTSPQSILPLLHWELFSDSLRASWKRIVASAASFSLQCRYRKEKGENVAAAPLHLSLLTYGPVSYFPAIVGFSLPLEADCPEAVSACRRTPSARHLADFSENPPLLLTRLMSLLWLSSDPKLFLTWIRFSCSKMRFGKWSVHRCKAAAELASQFVVAEQAAAN